MSKKQLLEQAHLMVLNHLIQLYEEMLLHDGYSNFSVCFKRIPGNKKQVIINSGCAHEYTVPMLHLSNQSTRFKVIDSVILSDSYTGPERRFKNRRYLSRRKKINRSRSFKLELRSISERRSSMDRRKK